MARSMLTRLVTRSNSLLHPKYHISQANSRIGGETLSSHLRAHSPNGPILRLGLQSWTLLLAIAHPKETLGQWEDRSEPQNVKTFDLLFGRERKLGWRSQVPQCCQSAQSVQGKAHYWLSHRRTDSFAYCWGFLLLQSSSAAQPTI